MGLFCLQLLTNSALQQKQVKVCLFRTFFRAEACCTLPGHGLMWPRAAAHTPSSRCEIFGRLLTL